MASSRALIPLLRRSVTTARTSSKALRGGASPPMPAYARIPAPSEPVSTVQYSTVQYVLFVLV
jgi:hypothetical protein